MKGRCDTGNFSAGWKRRRGAERNTMQREPLRENVLGVEVVERRRLALLVVVLIWNLHFMVFTEI